MNIKKFRKVSKISYTPQGRAYIRHGNGRLYIEDFERLNNNPWRGKNIDFKEYDAIHTGGYYLLKIIDNHRYTGEQKAQLYFIGE